MEAKKTPIEQSLIDRVVQGAKYVISGVAPDGWFTPNQPIDPVAQKQAEGRKFDYDVGWNIRVNSTKNNQEGTTFKELRSLADNYDLLRAVIETRKDQISASDWEIKYKEKDKKPDAKIKAIKEFFESPDKEHTHDTWIRAVLEDLLVIDAPCIYPRKTLGGDMYSLDLMDGGTINKLLDATGRTPMPPSPAYQQILKGMPAVNYTFDELVYMPRNVRSHKVYGFSPVEQIKVTVDIALHRQRWQLNYYTEGNIPEALASVPKEWSVEQLKEYQKYWDTIIEGDNAQKRKMKFIPDGINFIQTKEVVQKDEFDEWLSRLICFAFSLSPQALSKMMNRATAETAKDSADKEGLVPLKAWVKNFHDYIIQRHFGYMDVEFAWRDNAEPDAKTQADINVAYVNAGILEVNEVREDLGREPLSEEQLLARQARLNPFMQQNEDEENEDDPKQPPKDKEDDKLGKSLGVDGKSEASITKAKTPKPINRNRKEVTDAIDDLQGVLSKQLYTYGKKTSATIAKEWSALNRWQKGDYDRVYISGLTDGKAYLEDQGGTLTLKVIANEGADVAKLEEQVKAQLTSILGSSWESTVTYQQVTQKAKDADFYLSDLTAVNSEAIIKKVSPYAEDMYKKGVEAGFASIVYKPEYEMLKVLNERATEWASERALELAKLDEATKNYLRPVIENSIKESHNVGTLKRELVNSYGFSPYRAEMIARTEMAFADSQGNLDAWKATGLVKYKRSVLGTNEDHGEDDIANAEQGAIPIDEPFQSGHMTSPYHPNCMCTVVAVMENEE